MSVATEQVGEYLSVTAVAAKFGCSPGKLRNLRKNGPAFVPMIGGRETARTKHFVRYHVRQVRLMELAQAEEITVEAANVQWEGILAGMGEESVVDSGS